MDISIQELSQIQNLEDMDIHYNVHDPKIYALYQSFKNEIEFDGQVKKDFLDFLKSKQVVSVSVMSNSNLLEYLRKKNPVKYPKPNSQITITELLEKSKEYIALNKKSQKQRRIVVLQDVHYENLRLNKIVKIIPYNSYIGEKSVEALKQYKDYQGNIDVQDSESGVLVFVPDAKDFKLKVDLFALLATFDFPIYDSSSVDEAFEIYKSKKPRIVVLTNLDSDVRSKELLLKMEDFDPFVKKLNFVESPASHKDREIKRIGRYYSSGYKELMKNADFGKELLPEEIKISILDNIKDVESNFSKELFYEKAYALKQFGRYFNITILWNMLKNIEKKYL